MNVNLLQMLGHEQSTTFARCGEEATAGTVIVICEKSYAGPGHTEAGDQCPQC